MIIEGIPSWISAVALISLYLVAVINIGLIVEDVVRKARPGELQAIPLKVEDRRRPRR